MPLYRFYCSNCEHAFEVFLRLSELNAEHRCPECGGQQVEGPLQDSAAAAAPACDLKNRT